MKVEFLRSGAAFGLGYHTGEVADLGEEKAKKLIEAGVVIPAKEKAKETADSKTAKEKAVKT